MIQLLQNIWGLIQIFWQFLSNQLTSLMTALSLVTASVVLPQSIVPYLPSIIGTSVLLTVTIFVIKFVIGR